MIPPHIIYENVLLRGPDDNPQKFVVLRTFLTETACDSMARSQCRLSACSFHSSGTFQCSSHFRFLNCFMSMSTTFSIFAFRTLTSRPYNNRPLYQLPRRYAGVCTLCSYRP